MNQDRIVNFYDQRWSKPMAAKGVSAVLRRRQIISLVRKYTKASELQILDLGCGKGYLSEALSRFGNVTAVDYAKKTIESNQKRVPHIKFICADVTDSTLPKALGDYDLVVTSEVIEHIPLDKRSNFLNNVDGVLRRGALLIITTPYRESLLKLKPSGMTDDEFLAGIDDQPIDNIMRKHELLALLSPNFRFLEFSSVQPPVKYRALDLLWKAAFLPIGYRFVNQITQFLRIDGKYMVVACTKR